MYHHVTEIQKALLNAIENGDGIEVESVLSRASIPHLNEIERTENEGYDFIFLSILKPDIFKILWTIYREQIDLDRKSNIFFMRFAVIVLK